MRRLILSSLLIFLLKSVSFATYQDPEILIYKGKRYDLHSSPLEAFYNYKLPKFWVEPNERWSSNGRGFIATWEIINDKLYLIKIDSWFCRKSIRTKNGCRRVTLQDLFGRKVVNGRVSASWYTDKMEVTFGEQLLYASKPNLPIFEYEMFFDVEDGKVSEPELIDNYKRFPPPPGEGPPPPIRKSN